ncbi:MAG: pyruvate formate lyase family protein, partial [Candidatus Thorarchaeota archaeon]
MLSERVKHLRDISVNTKPYLSGERADLLTRFYQTNGGIKSSTPVTRALAFKYILENKHIFIDKGELIVGERGPAPRATPTYPELCCHSLQDLDILNTREQASFTVHDNVRRLYREKIIPYWKGKSMRERVFTAMTDEWHSAFEAGLFTEFMEQRAPGHAILDNKIYYRGLLDFKQDIEKAIAILDFQKDSETACKKQELLAMVITIDALIQFANRHAEKALELARTEKNVQRKKELEKIAEICSHVPAHAPRSFWEALQMYWFVHLGVVTELNVWDSFNPGRLDQHLFPFYAKELANGTLTKKFAKELLQCFWIKFNNQPAPPKVDITVEQSGTYQDFALINTGGLTKDGKDAVNAVSYLLLEV